VGGNCGLWPVVVALFSLFCLNIGVFIALELQ